MTPEEAAGHVERVGEAFAAGDLQAALAAFVPGDEVLYAGSEPGECATGRAGLAALFADLFARDERYRWRCEAVTLAASPADVAVCADVALSVLPAGEVFPYRICGILAPLPGGGWAWRMFVGSEPLAAT